MMSWRKTRKKAPWSRSRNEDLEAKTHDVVEKNEKEGTLVDVQVDGVKCPVSLDF